MQVYIFNPNYEIIGVVDEAESVLWHKKYNDIGESEIYIPCSTEYLELLKKGNYIFRYDDDMFCKIEDIKIETNVEQGDYIIAPAKDNCTILSGRIVRWQIVYSGTVAGFIQKVLTDNVISPAQPQRAIPDFEIDTSNFSALNDTIEVSTFTEDLLQLIIKTCKTYNYGFRLSYNINTHKLVFRLYKGVNKTLRQNDEYVEFSPQFSNIISSSYEETESNYKNLAYVSYKDNAEQVHLLSVYNGTTEPTGENRRELYVDGTGTSRTITAEELKQMFPTVTKTTQTATNTETEETTVTATYYITVDGENIAVATSTGEGEDESITVTDYTYLLLIKAIGYNALAEHTRTQTFVGEVDTLDTYEYKTDYNIGDIVKVINDYGIEAEAQITAVMESDDNDNGYQCEPTFEYIS